MNREKYNVNEIKKYVNIEIEQRLRDPTKMMRSSKDKEICFKIEKFIKNREIK